MSLINALVTLSFLMAGCGFKTNNSEAVSAASDISPKPSATVSISGPAVVSLGATASYSAQVSGTSNPAVNWSVNQVAGGSAEAGQISANGLYKAPLTMPESSTITISAESVVSPESSESVVLTLRKLADATTPTCPTSIAPRISGPTTVTLGGTAQYSAALEGVSSQSVAWSVDGVDGGNAANGTVSSAGLYVSPPLMPANNSVAITATSLANIACLGTVSATLLQPVPVIVSATGVIQSLGPTMLIDITGSGFAPGAEILIGGIRVTTESTGSNQLQTAVSAPENGAATLALAVMNPGPGGSQSAPYTLLVSPTTVSQTAAARFLDQSTFGPTVSSLIHVQQIGLEAALIQQFDEPVTLFSQPAVLNAECPTSNFECTRSEFLSVAVFGNDQLRQRVAMALSELWVAPTHESNAMPFYLNTLARDAFTNYRTIMQDASLSPTMGSYLNMVNSGTAPAGQIANENFARELMQLFTMGLNLLNPDGSLKTDTSGNTVPAYSEEQVEAFARAYTGWTFAPADGSIPSSFNNPVNWKAFLRPVQSKHDTTEKILLGGVTLAGGQTAEEDMQRALDNVFEQQNVAPFVSRQLIQHLVTGNPSPGYVQRVSTVFADNGNGVRGDMKAILTAILLDPEARAADVQTADELDQSPSVESGHLREPLLWAMNVIRGLNASKSNPTDPYPFVNFMSASMNGLEEAPFNQESVFNFFPPQYTIPQSTVNAPEFDLENTGTIGLRDNAADPIVHNQVSGLTVDLSATSPFGTKASDPAELVDFLGLIFLHNQMPTAMRTALISAVSAIPAAALQERAEVAVYLVITSSQYKVMH